MGYKAVINDPSYLCHFNPFHSRKSGQFTFKNDPNRIAVAKREVDSILTSKQESVNKLIEKGDKLIDIANALGNEYKKAFSNAKLTDAAKKQILDGLEEDFGKIDDPQKSRFQQIKSNCDGGVYFYWALEEHIDKALFDSLKSNEKLSKLSSEFEDLKESYWKEAHEIVGDMEEKYKNVDFGFVNNYIYGEKLETSIPSYITRHFDDYWVNDTDEHYSAVERWTKELESDSASHSLDISEDSLTHYNKNHSKTNGQFISGDGDGDGIVDDHHNYKKNKVTVNTKSSSGTYKSYDDGKEKKYKQTITTIEKKTGNTKTVDDLVEKSEEKVRQEFGIPKNVKLKPSEIGNFGGANRLFDSINNKAVEIYEKTGDVKKATDYIINNMADVPYKIILRQNDLITEGRKEVDFILETYGDKYMYGSQGDSDQSDEEYFWYNDKK